MIGAIRRYWTRKDGTTAVEFAFLCIPYLILTVGIIEIAIMFASASLLEGATSAAARMVRTGQIQQTTTDVGQQEDLFRQELCNFAVVLLDCNNVFLEVVNMGGFSNYGDFAMEFDVDGNPLSRGFSVGGVNDVILIRTAYRYSLMTPMISSLLGEAGTGTRLFVSTIVLQTEPYEFTGEEDNV